MVFSAPLPVKKVSSPTEALTVESTKSTRSRLISPDFPKCVQLWRAVSPSSMNIFWWDRYRCKDLCLNFQTSLIRTKTGTWRESYGGYKIEIFRKIVFTPPLHVEEEEDSGGPSCRLPHWTTVPPTWPLLKFAVVIVMSRAHPLDNYYPTVDHSRLLARKGLK